MSEFNKSNNLNKQQLDTMDKIVDYGRKNKFSDQHIQLAVKTAFIESSLGLNAGKNPSSSAIGVFQYTIPQWNQYHSNLGERNDVDNQIKAFYQDIKKYDSRWNDKSITAIPRDQLKFEEYVYIKHHDGPNTTDFTNADGLKIWKDVKFTAPLSKNDNGKVEQPTNLQNPVDLESQKAAYQERYQQLAGKVMENPEFAGASSRDIDLGVAVCVVQERKQSSGNLNLEETNNEIAGILSQSSQVKEWKETLDRDDYLETSTAYIEDIQTSCQKIHQQDFDYCQE